MRKVHNPTDAEDLVQQVFWRVWQWADQWIPHGEFSAWLYKIAKNLALNHLRTLNRRKEQPIESAPHTADEAGEHFTITPFWMADPSAVQPDKALEQDEQSKLIHQLVDRLPEAKRKVINLIYYSDLSIDQTAQVLHIPEGTVKSRLHYAIKQLTQEWQALASEWLSVRR